MTGQSTSAPTQADLDVARLLRSRLGISPSDLLDAAPTRSPAPTFAEYIPVVSDAVSAGTRRGYGPRAGHRATQPRHGGECEQGGGDPAGVEFAGAGGPVAAVRSRARARRSRV